MTLAKLRKRVRAAQDNVNTQISAQASLGGMYARGLAREGYLGGYVQALMDVCLLINDVEPNDDRNIWRTP